MINFDTLFLTLQSRLTWLKIEKQDDYEGNIRSIWVYLSPDIRLHIYHRKDPSMVGSILRPLKDTKQDKENFVRVLDKFDKLNTGAPVIRKKENYAAMYAWPEFLTGSIDQSQKRPATDIEFFVEASERAYQEFRAL